MASEPSTLPTLLTLPELGDVLRMRDKRAVRRFLTGAGIGLVYLGDGPRPAVRVRGADVSRALGLVSGRQGQRDKREGRAEYEAARALIGGGA